MKCKTWSHWTSALVAGCCLMAALGSAAFAQTDPAGDPAQRKAVEDRLGAKVDTITKTPYAGLYEVKIGNDILYTDAHGDYLFVGNVIDLKNRENLTRHRVEALTEASLPQMKFADFPVDNAIKVVKGNGKRTMIAFEDPNCGYCKRLEKTLQGVDDVTVYVFLYPILGDDSVDKAKAIWCSADRAKTWEGWMANGTAISSKAGCANPVDKTVELGHRLQVDGTPTLFFPSGKRVPGAISADEIKALLSPAG